MASSSSSSPEISAANGAHQDGRFSYKHATHEEVLEDLSSRFILNLPDEELASLERICFQVEQAHWFYEDFIREENPKFPSLPLKKFSATLFHACPLLHQWSHDHEQAFNTFMQYKTRVPVCGAIMLNDTWEKCVLVKGWKSSSGWGFPKGKINEDELPVHCAVREVLEETGYNLAGKIDPQNVIEMSIKEQKISLFIVPGIPEDYLFKTKTRKEISKIEWFKLIDLPTWRRNKTAAGRFYLISPFIGALKAFVNERKPRAAPRKPPRAKKPPQNQTPYSHEQYSYDVDITQESSSQSSSAENGEPQTPSPHYSESLANPIPQVEGDDSTKPGSSDIPLDPHFVRLLSSLTMSASKSKGPEDVQKHTNIPLSIDINQHDNKESRTPVPISASFTGLTRPVDHTDWSTSVPKPFTPSSPYFRGTTSTPLSTEVTPPSHYPPLSLIQNSPTHSTHPSNEAGVRHPQSPSHPTPFPSTLVPSSPTNTVVSARSISRRASSIADISPYLSRPNETPPSAKTMQQIALLEAVADESARMSSLAFREPSTDLHGTRYNRHGTPSVPPPSLVPHDLGISGTSLPSDLPYGPYHTRSWTSHAFHPIPPTHLGGAENHLLSLMNSPRTASQVPYFYPHVQHARPIQAGAIPASPHPFPVTSTPEIPRYHGSTNIPHHNPNSLLSVLNDSRRRSGV